MALRLSVREFASELGVAARTVSKWENAGEARTPRPYMQAVLDTALARADRDAHLRFEQATGRSSAHSTGALGPVPRQVAVVSGASTAAAGQQAAERSVTEPGSPEFWLPARTATDTRSFAARDVALDRRTVLSGGLATLAVGTRLTEPIDGWAAGIALYFSANRAGTVTEEEVGQIEATGQALRDWDDRFHRGVRRKAVLGQLTEVAEIVQLGQPPELERRLFGAMAELGKIAATMSWDAGLDGEAQHYYLLSLRASHAAHDRLFGVNVLAAMARQMVYLNRAADALDIVRAAADSAAGATPRVHAMLRVREAWAHARMGRAEAFRRMTGKAEELLPDQAPSPTEPYWIGGFDRSELAGTTGGRYLELATVTGKRQAYVDAAAYISEALALRAEKNSRSRALDTINLARARLGTAEPVEAARLAVQAMGLARQTHSGHVDRKLKRFREESVRFSGNNDVRQARDELEDYLYGQGRRRGGA